VGAVTTVLYHMAPEVRAAWRSPEEIKNSVSLWHVDGGQKQHLDHIMSCEDLKKKYLNQYPFPE